MACVRHQLRVGEHGRIGGELLLEPGCSARRTVAHKHDSCAQRLDLRALAANLSHLLAAEHAAEVTEPHDHRRMLGPLAGELDLCAAGIENRRSGQRPCVHGATYSTWPRSDSAPRRRRPTVVHGEALDVLRSLPDGCAGLVYVDPPFNTGDARTGIRSTATEDASAARLGFAGRHYRVEQQSGRALRRPLRRLPRVASPSPRSRRAASSRGRARCTSTSIRASRTTARCCSTRSSDARASSTRWCGHTTTVRARNAAGPRSTMSSSCTSRILASITSTRPRSRASRTWRRSLQTPERAARGKLPTDVWWHTIVPTSSRERTGYPTQKPLGILRRVVAASSRPGDLVVDWCAGSGTTGCGCGGAGPPLSAHRQ